MLLLLATALFTSCKKSVPRQAKFIPKNSLFVAAINTGSLKDKLMKNEATIENIFKSMNGGDSVLNKGKKEYEEFKESGIDLSENIYLSVVQKGGGSLTSGKGNMVTTGVAVLKDASKLEAYIKKKKTDAVITKEKDYSYTTLANEQMIAWGKDVVIAMTYNSVNTGGMEFDSTTGKYNFKQPANAEKDVKAEMTNYFNLKEDESIASVPEFRDLSQEKGDAILWMNSSASVEDMPLPLPKLKDLISNSYTAAVLNFEDGKVAVNSKSYSSKAMKDILDKYAGPTADLGLIENFPSNNINGFMVFAFNPELFNAVVKYLEVGGMVDGYLTKMMGSTYTMQDAIKIMKGDIAVILGDLSFGELNPTMGVPREMPKAKFIFNMPVGDKTQLNRIMDKLVESQMVVKIGNEYKPAPAMGNAVGMYALVDDKNIFIASDSLTLAQYKAKSTKAGIPADVKDGFSKKSAIGYVSIESLLNAFPVNPNDSMSVAVMPKAKETFKDIKFYSENFNGKYTEAHFELNMKNAKENSLTSLLNFFAVVGKEAEKNEKRQNEMMGVDTTTVAIPLDTLPGE